MTAVWVRDEGDDEPFDYEVRIHQSGRDSETVASGEFSFAKMFHRIDAVFVFTTITKVISGIADIECRIRRRGATDWMTQSFPLGIEVLLVEATPAETPVESANQN